MTSFSADLLVHQDIFDAYKSISKTAPRLIKRRFVQIAERSRSRLLNRLRVEPGGPKYPIRWASDRQRRYVMAKLRREGNLPYRRTGAYVRAWQVIDQTNDYDGFLRVENESGIEQYVTGARQQPFHLDTGWYRDDVILLEESEFASDLLINAWIEIDDLIKAGRA